MSRGTPQDVKAGSTLRSSQAVPHPSTNRALRRLTSEVGRDPVYSTRYGRQRVIVKTWGWRFVFCICVCVSHCVCDCHCECDCDCQCLCDCEWWSWRSVVVVVGGGWADNTARGSTGGLTDATDGRAHGGTGGRADVRTGGTTDGVTHGRMQRTDGRTAQGRTAARTGEQTRARAGGAGDVADWAWINGTPKTSSRRRDGRRYGRAGRRARERKDGRRHGRAGGRVAQTAAWADGWCTRLLF